MTHGKSGWFWFNYAARTCLDMDDMYWYALHERASSNCYMINESTMLKLEPLIEKKLEQRKAYRDEFAIRFADYGDKYFPGLVVDFF